LATLISVPETSTYVPKVSEQVTEKKLADQLIWILLADRINLGKS
jgi:hypothetical protein